jgi:hypothetical protein
MKDEEFWDDEHILKDLLFDSSNSIHEIADELGLTVTVLNRKIKELGLDWVRKGDRKMSRGQASLTKIIGKLLPNEPIVYEHSLGERLRLDIYIPTYKLGFEYHGRQHFFYSSLFHGSPEDFAESQARDERKMEICREQSIALVVFRFTDKLTEDSVYERILASLESTPYVREEKPSRYKGNAYYEARKEAARVHRKKKYQEIKRMKRDSR